LLEAQQFEWLVKGVYRTNDPELQQKEWYDATGNRVRPQGIKPPDQREQQNQTLTQREQALATQEKGLQDRDWTTWSTQYLDTSSNGAKWAAFDQEIDKVLAPVKEKYDPMIFNAVRKEIKGEVINKIKQDALFVRNHTTDRSSIEQQFRDAWKQGKNPKELVNNAQLYNNQFLSRARKYIPSVVQPLLKKATATAVASNTPRPPNSPQKPRAAATNGTTPQPQGRGINESEWEAIFAPFK